MAVFVTGTAPLFTVLGYAAARARHAGGAWRKRLAVGTGLIVLAMGVYTLNGGLAERRCGHDVRLRRLLDSDLPPRQSIG